jgi:SAM-dependent methyltransferase
MRYGDDVFSGNADPRRHAPAADRNAEPIRGVLARWLPNAGTVLEIASGTGQHAAHFAARAPNLTWQPSDPDAEMRASIDAHARAAGLGNVAPALALDVTQPWPIATADAVVCVNLLHIAPWAATAAVMAGAGTVLPAGGPLIVYGPFKRGGRHTAESNARFDDQLRMRDPAWGIRDLDDVAAEAEANGLARAEVTEMPANNLTVVFRRDG